tara:strand:+ start:322768 stop:323880 length:1113 start_codon:yes stop_codon:yes gene_type:complete
MQETPVNETSRTTYDPLFVRNMLESALRISFVLLLLVLSYDIIKPFTVPILWGAIIAMAAFPLVKWLESRIGGRRGLASTLVTVAFIAALVVPAWTVTDSLLGNLQTFSQALASDSVHVKAPPEKIRDWPVIGDKVYAAWSAANQDLRSVIAQAAPELRQLTTTLIKQLGSSVIGVLMFVVSLIIAGGFMAYADSCASGAHRFFVRVGGLKPGGEWAPLTVATVRSVLQGVVGVALIQAALVSIGLFVAGVPGAAIWSTLVLFLAIAQLPALLVLAPIMVYVFSTADTTTAVIFIIYQLLAGLSDNILKPMLMGRGLDIPMPVILIGAIGGMIASGIIGLFAGAVVLSIWYKLFGLWLEQEAHPESSPAS